MRASRCATGARSRTAALALAALVVCCVVGVVVGDVGAEQAQLNEACDVGVHSRLACDAGDVHDTAGSCDATRSFDVPGDEQDTDGGREGPTPKTASPPQGDESKPPNLHTEFLTDRYIVRFKDYKMIGAHRATIESMLGAPANVQDLDPTLYVTHMQDVQHPPSDDASSFEGSSWELVERRNKAAAYPTDFAVIVIPGNDATSDDDVTKRSSVGPISVISFITSKLQSLPNVRDVRLEQKFTRSLSWDESEEVNDESEDSSQQKGSQREGLGGSHTEETADTGLHWSEEELLNRKARRRAEKQSGKKKNTEIIDDAAHGGGGGQLPGRLRTRPTIGMEPEGHSGNFAEDNSDENKGEGRKLLRASRGASPPVAQAMGASFLWEKGFSGKGIKMGVFDTGVKADHPHFRKVKERSNWTHEDTLNDGLGHGTFVAGVVASQDGSCPGFAPDSEIHTFRVFTNDQVSYTSWFLDAFNYAIASEVKIINLSIGGPDYLDYPFTDKINEIVANGIIMISAIGNDGPLWGTLNNPADQLDVIGVGGIDFKDTIAPFSSRGMSTHELPNGYGRVKPDIVAYGRDVMGSKIQGGCRSLSGTSVASPVVAGAVTLLASTVPENKRWDILNPGSIKQALVEGATKLTNGKPTDVDFSMYAQGAGKLNLVNSFEILRDYVPRASLVPGEMDFEFGKTCPYSWPHCTQPLYYASMPFMFNATVVNGMGLGGWISEVPRFVASEVLSDDGSADLGEHLDFRFDFSETLWPWSGFLAIYVRVKEEAKWLSGTASGVVTFQVQSPPGRGETELRTSTVTVPIKFSVIPTPPRQKRILWSQYHSVRYPPGYVPRDSLDVKADILDWHGDHPHTNFHKMYDYLVSNGYYVEVLGSPLTCFDADIYGAILLVDSEEEYSNEEIKKLENDVKTKGLGVAVFAEWYNVKQMESMRFFDDNTHSYWTPVTGGANVPALNDLLKPFQIQLGDRVLKGTVMLKSGEPIVYATGCDIAVAPVGAHVHTAQLVDHAKNSPDGGNVPVAKNKGNSEHAVAVFLDEKAVGGSGRISVFGDSNCLDSSHSSSECFAFLVRTLKFLTEKDDTTGLTPADGSRRQSQKYSPYGDSWIPPIRRTDVDFDSLSTTRGGRPGNEGVNICYGPNNPLEFQDDDTRSKSVYTQSTWSKQKASEVIHSRPHNWRERLSDGVKSELNALGDVFAERRREVSGVDWGVTGLVDVDSDADELNDDPIFRTPSLEEHKQNVRERVEEQFADRFNTLSKSGFKANKGLKRSQSGSADMGYGDDTSQLGTLTAIVEKVKQQWTSFETVVVFVSLLVICVCRARYKKRAKKTSSRQATPAKRGRRLAP